MHRSLKKDGHFPIHNPGKIALYGSGARKTVFGRTGSGEVNSRETVSVERGLEKVGFKITTGSWLDAYDKAWKEAYEAFRRKIIAEAKAAHMIPMIYGMGAVMPEPEYYIPLDGEGDTAVYVLARTSGEGSDRKPVRGDVLLSETEERDVLADLLLGKSFPSGKLTTSWVLPSDLPSVGTFGDPDDTLYKEGIYVGYRYYDTFGKSPLFPFGYGLPYADFDVKITDVCMKEKTAVEIHAEITNAGGHTGKEILEAYVSLPSEKLDQPYQVLAGFAKTEALRESQKTNLEISFDLRNLASYNEEQESYVMEAGDYILRVGPDSRHTEKAAIFHLAETAIVRKAPAVLGHPGFKDLIPPLSDCDISEHTKEGTSVRKFTLIPEDVTMDEPEQDPEGFADSIERKCYDKVRKLPTETVLRLNMGLFNEKGGVFSVVGNAAQHVAGAAGETTNLLERKKVPGLIMADGPAGLRLSRDYYIDKSKKKVAMSNLFPESVNWLMPKPVSFVLSHTMEKKPPKGVEVFHQYCTAIPIGTAIAQSFNISLAEALGDMVGEEMERFHVQLWLAPALNIHRSILCGRNYEYYSEDPLVSGEIAAAITRGVQKHPGCGTTIKHFAANNQEFNRYTSNSCVSERAMREIYLKGFEICIQRSQPNAVMTSYNLLNGTHTSEHKGLIEEILRHEFGFKGLVMTDWVISGMKNANSRYPMPDPAKVAAAGNDLYMPGSKGDMKRLEVGLAEGRVTSDQHNRNAARVLSRMLKDAHDRKTASKEF